MKAKRTMRQKTSPKVRQKLTLVYAAAGIAVAALVGVGLFMYINLGSNTDTKAAKSLPSFTSKASGDWTEEPTWVNGSIPNSTKADVLISRFNTSAPHEVEHYGDLTFDEGTLTVAGTLIIYGNLTMGNKANVTVNDGGRLIITGNFTATNKIIVGNMGIIAIQGNMNFSPSKQDTYDGENGKLFVLGTITGNDDATYLQQDSNDLQEKYPQIYNLFNTTLPIQLSYFTVKMQDRQAEITWATDMEENNDYFSIERSADGKTFEQAATVAGAGNSTSKLVYSYTDSKALPGTSYYRLKQTDYDGKFTYSRIESVSRSASGMFASVLNIEIVAPNPFTDNFFMSYTLPSDGQVEVRLINMQGIVAFSEKIEGFEGQNQYEFYDRKGMKSGTYLLSISHRNATSKVERLIKR